MPGFSLPSALHSSAIRSHWRTPVGSQPSDAAGGGQPPCDAEQSRGRVMKGSEDEQACGTTSLWEEVGGRKKNYLKDHMCNHLFL